MTTTAPQILPYAHRQPSRLAQLLMRPIGIPFFLLLFLVAAHLFYLARFPWSIIPDSTLQAWALAVGGLFLLRLTLRSSLFYIYHQPQNRHWRGNLRFLLALLVATTIYASLHYAIPAKLAFWYSKPALNSVIAGKTQVPSKFSFILLTSTPAVPPRVTVGIYTITDSTYHSGGVFIFQVEDGNPHLATELVYVPPESRSQWVFTYGPSYTPLGDGWFYKHAPFLAC